MIEDWFTRVVDNLVGRIHGPLTFRLILQPIMAAIFAARDGISDARQGKVPYFWSLVNDAQHRRDMIRNGWKSVGRVFILAVTIDAIYQFIEFRFFYPFEALLVAAILALIPYLILRGPVTRLMRAFR